MNNASLKKRREVLQIISQWRQSGLSQGVFCKQEGIARTTFQSWRKRYDPTYEYQNKKNPINSNSSKASFIPLELEASTAAPNYELEIIYENGVVLRCSSKLPISDLQKLVTIQPA